MSIGVAYIYFITQGISLNIPLIFRVQGCFFIQCSRVFEFVKIYVGFILVCVM